MDDAFGLKDNVQGFVTITLPRFNSKFIHEEFDDVVIQPAVEQGSCVRVCEQACVRACVRCMYCYCRRLVVCLRA
jgi:hypothetical protein